MFFWVTSLLRQNNNPFWIASIYTLSTRVNKDTRLCIHDWYPLILILTDIGFIEKSQGQKSRHHPKKIAVYLLRQGHSHQFRQTLWSIFCRQKGTETLMSAEFTGYCLSHDGCHSDLHPVSQHNMMHQKRFNGHNSAVLANHLSRWYHCTFHQSR